jgi:hypothetical protein
MKRITPITTTRPLLAQTDEKLTYTPLSLILLVSKFK